MGLGHLHNKLKEMATEMPNTMMSQQDYERNLQKPKLVPNVTMRR